VRSNVVSAALFQHFELLFISHPFDKPIGLFTHRSVDWSLSLKWFNDSVGGNECRWILAPCWSVVCSLKMSHEASSNNLNEGKWGSLATNHACISPICLIESLWIYRPMTIMPNRLASGSHHPSGVFDNNRLIDIDDRLIEPVIERWLFSVSFEMRDVPMQVHWIPSLNN